MTDVCLPILWAEKIGQLHRLFDTPLGATELNWILVKFSLFHLLCTHLNATTCTEWSYVAYQLDCQ